MKGNFQSGLDCYDGENSCEIPGLMQDGDRLEGGSADAAAQGCGQGLLQVRGRSSDAQENPGGQAGASPCSQYSRSLIIAESSISSIDTSHSVNTRGHASDSWHAPTHSTAFQAIPRTQTFPTFHISQSDQLDPTTSTCFPGPPSGPGHHRSYQPGSCSFPPALPRAPLGWNMTYTPESSGPSWPPSVKTENVTEDNMQRDYYFNSFQENDPVSV